MKNNRLMANKHVSSLLMLNQDVSSLEESFFEEMGSSLTPVGLCMKTLQNSPFKSNLVDNLEPPA